MHGTRGLPALTDKLDSSNWQTDLQGHDRHVKKYRNGMTRTDSFDWLPGQVSQVMMWHSCNDITILRYPVSIEAGYIVSSGISPGYTCCFPLMREFIQPFLFVSTIFIRMIFCPSYSILFLFSKTIPWVHDNINVPFLCLIALFSLDKV